MPRCIWSRQLPFSSANASEELAGQACSHHPAAICRHAAGKSNMVEVLTVVLIATSTASKHGACQAGSHHLVAIWQQADQTHGTPRGSHSYFECQQGRSSPSWQTSWSSYLTECSRQIKSTVLRVVLMTTSSASKDRARQADSHHLAAI